MKFDPTFNYSETDLSVERNFVFRNFHELVKTLLILASTAEKQLELSGMGAALGMTTEDMGIDFERNYTYYKDDYSKFDLLTLEQKAQLEKLNNFFDARPFSSSPDFWDDSQLGTHPDWEIVRKMSTEILTMLNMSDVQLQFEQSEYYDIAENGDKLRIEQTITKLIR